LTRRYLKKILFGGGETMPNYMVLIKDSNGLGTEFFDDWDETDSFLYDIDTAAVVEIYERVYDDEGEHYEFLERR